MARDFKENNSTIKDVAILAGVSVATAGRVIGDYGRVSQESREKVQKAVKELNYIPNAIAQGMRKHSTKTIAVVVPNISNNFFSDAVGAIERITRKEDYNLLICNTHESQTTELQYMEMLHHKQVDGIILASTFNDKRSIPEKSLYLYLDLPVILFDRRIKGFDLDIVESEHQKAAYVATKYLIDLGHTKIVAIGSLSKHITTTIIDRVNGYKKALKEARIPFCKDFVFNLDYENDNDAELKLKPLLDQHKVTAIIILNNSLCASVLQVLQKNGTKIPEDISVINWDDEKYCELLDITTIDQQVAAIGKYAAERLFYYINGANSIEDKKVSMNLKTRLIIRGSCRSLI